MPNNITILDSNSAVQTLITTQTAGVHTPHHLIDGTVTVTGTVSVGNFPASVEITDGTNILLTSGHPGYIQGSVSVSNFPSTQNVNITNSAVAVTIATLPALPSGTNVIGHVIVDTAPLTTVNGTVSTDASGPVIPNTVASKSLLIGGQYNTTPITLTNQQQAAIQVDSNGYLKINIAAGSISGNTAAGLTGSAVPASAGYTGFNSGGNLVGVSASNPLPVSGTFYQVTQPVSLATLPALPSGSNTIGGVTQSGTWNIGLGTINDTSPSTVNITAQDTNSVTNTYANSQVFITGTPTAGSTAAFALSTGYNTVRFLVTGTWTGTLVVEWSPDSSTWIAQGIHQTGTSYSTSSFTNNFTGQGSAAGFTNVRIRSTAAWTGTATVRVVESINEATTYIGNGIALRDATIQSNMATIKSASTSALATDPALVVTTPTSVTSSSPAATSVTSSSASILASNTARREAIVINTGTTVVFLGLGQTPTITAYAVVLKACSSANDGTGGSFVTDVWKGAINAISASTGTVVVTELT